MTSGGRPSHDHPITHDDLAAKASEVRKIPASWKQRAGSHQSLTGGSSRPVLLI
ncbi:MAG: hypothetical protein ACXAEU_09270 [Candidatus Hodarchaeales archaeon]